MTALRKLTIAGAVLLVCGVIVALMVRRPAPWLALTLHGFGTNAEGVAVANILVSNTSPHRLYVDLRTRPFRQTLLPSHEDNGEYLDFSTQRTWTIKLPDDRPCCVIAEGYQAGGPVKLSDRIRHYLSVHLSSSLYPHDAVTLDIP